jgi:hypothetical protein
MLYKTRFRRACCRLLASVVVTIIVNDVNRKTKRQTAATKPTAILGSESGNDDACTTLCSTLWVVAAAVVQITPDVAANGLLLGSAFNPVVRPATVGGWQITWSSASKSAVTGMAPGSEFGEKKADVSYEIFTGPLVQPDAVIFSESTVRNGLLAKKACSSVCRYVLVIFDAAAQSVGDGVPLTPA